MKLTLTLLTALMLAACSRALAEVPLAKDDTILFYGNSMVERLLEHGELEAMVQLAQPGKNLHFRSLAWTGDEVGIRLRAEGYAAHMKELLAAWPAKVVVVGYGMNEAFGGAAGLPVFRKQLAGYLDQLARLHSGAKLVVLSPTAVEKSTLERQPDVAARNADVALYSAALADAAKARGELFVDLFTASRDAFAKSKTPLTTNGIHLNADGNRTMAQVIARALVGDAAVANVSAARVAEVAPAAAQLAHFVEEVVRPKNGVLYYGVRKRPDERAAEMPLYLQRIEKADVLVHEMAAKPDAKFANFSPISLPPPAPWTKPGSKGDVGVVRDAAEAQAEFKVADGYTVNLFASDEQFPELRAPVQIAFDARGRLWVVTMPSFPHTVPGQSQEDKIIVLEDTDRDGKADKCTTFAGGLDTLDGIAFSEHGVVVSEQPRHWLMQDTDGDGRADTRRELLRGVDVTDSHHGGMIAADPTGAIWLCDGVFHRSQLETPYGVHRSVDSTTLRHDLRTGRVETEWQSITPNPWKITFDRWGNTYQMYGDGLVMDGLALTWTPLGAYHPFAHAKFVGYGKGSAAASISSPNFSEEYQQGMASAALLGNHAVAITKVDFDEGAARGSGRLDLVSSPNAAFRPADVEFGFDGALYISDFCSTIIGHAQNPMRDPRWNHTKGRIWRVTRNDGPVEKKWPRIEGASAAELCALLTHPQDIVRHHARIALRKIGQPGLDAVDAWLAKLPANEPERDQAMLETIFVAEGLGQTRPALLAALCKSEKPEYRAAAIHFARLQADRLSDFASILAAMAADKHPRVRMEVIDAVAHLRPRLPEVEHILHTGIAATEPAVKRMLNDLAFGTKPLISASVPVLEIAPETKLAQWQDAGGGVQRTFVKADAATPATLAVKHGFLDVAVNGVQVFSFDSQWSSDQQVPLELFPGLNVIEITFRRLKGNPPVVYLFDTIGQRLRGVNAPADAMQFAALLDEYEKANAARGEVIRVQSAPELQFAPKELRAKAGTKVRLIFDNPDLMIHNFVLCAPGSEEEVGALADKLAADPNGMAKSYIPESPKILQHTGLVAPKARAELTFNIPQQPGRYPYLCTFPGHWRVMRGVLVVE
jgi:putative membrane-bound dehydrogenase-like protein